MDENVEPTGESVNDSVAPANKKKTRRDNKGRPKQKPSQVNGDPIESLSDADQDMIDMHTSLGATVHPPTSSASSTSSAEVKKPRKKKAVAEVLLEQSLARERAALQSRSSEDVAGQSAVEEVPADKGKSRKKAMLRENAQPGDKVPAREKGKKKVAEGQEGEGEGQEPPKVRGKKRVVAQGQEEDGQEPPKVKGKKKVKPVVTSEEAGQEEGTSEQPAKKPKSKSRSKPKKAEEVKVAKPRLRKKKPNVTEGEEGPRKEGPPAGSSGKKNLKGSKEPGGMERPEDNKFPDHWSLEQVDKQVADGLVVKSAVRINKKNFREAYVNSPDGGTDFLLEGVRARNRALEGDEVAVLVLPQEQWKRSNNKSQRTGQVVCILRKEHHRQAVGSLTALPDSNSVWALFSPRDNRMPPIRVLAATCPPNFATMSDMLYLAEVKEWNDVRFAVGELLQTVGMSGNIEAETRTILMDNGLETEPYGPEMSKFFPSLPYTIPQAELARREDFRDLCVFTIDPATARDLDDAVSFRELPDGQGAEVGVHISDVSFFLTEGTELDLKVCSRATTTYLVQSVFHMLPPDLCRLCSLTPGEDKLAFSVLWRVTPEGEFLEPRFTRSVVFSACQMSYEQAQTIMDAPADKEWSREELPQIHGQFSPADVVATVRGLQPLALGLRALRFQGGALRIDQPKLSFQCDPASGLPEAFSVYQNQECHRLIEELMLLANTAVARHLHSHHPEKALLRSHPEPRKFMLLELQSLLRRFGVELDIASSGAMHASLQQYLGSEDPAEGARGWALSALLARTMKRANYICAAGTGPEEQRHYALSVPLYTHFTSPIRRYADVMVHRLLAACLDYTPLPAWHPDLVSKVASNCNHKKYSAKCAGDDSVKLFLTLYVEMHGPLREEAVVIDVKDHSFDVLVLRTGSTHRVYTDSLVNPVAKAEHAQLFPNVWEARISWREPPASLQVVKLFSIVTVELRKADRELRIDAKICPPALDN